MREEKRGHGVIIRDNVFWIVGGTAKAQTRQRLAKNHLFRTTFDGFSFRRMIHETQTLRRLQW